MYSKSELAAKAQIELIEIAKGMGIAKATRLDAQELIYKILDHQASNPDKQDQAGHQSDGDQPRKRQHMKPKLLAESTMKNPELHNSRKRPEAVAKKQPAKANAEVAEVPEFNLQLSSLEMPEVPEVPEVLSPMGRPLFRSSNREEVAETQAAPEASVAAESAPTAEAEAPAPQAQQPAKKKRGRPKKNAQPQPAAQPEAQTETEASTVEYMI